MSIIAGFTDHARVAAEASRTLPPVLEQVVAAVGRCLHAGGKVLACGNGGSATDAQHLVAELVGRFKRERPALPAIALTADIAILTAVANDYGYERVFARQVEALARAGDVLFALSTSGRSPNVLAAARAARERGCVVIGCTGTGGGELTTLSHHLIAAPSDVVARIQEVHALCIHLIVEAVDATIREQPAQ
jgi:D-sedoheptulose 7-phosphate isomerase